MQSLMHMKQLSPKVEAQPGLTTGAQMRFPSSLFGNERKGEEEGRGEESKGSENESESESHHFYFIQFLLGSNISFT